MICSIISNDFRFYATSKNSPASVDAHSHDTD